MDTQKDNSDTVVSQPKERPQFPPVPFITQQLIAPGAVKARHIGEGVKMIRSGVAAGKPSKPEIATASTSIYFDTTNNKLWVWNNVSKLWKSTTLT